MLSNQPGGVSHFGAEPDDAMKSGGVARRLISGLPTAVWARVLALFLALAGIKIALVLVLAKRLFDVHWRIGATETTWWSYVAFGAFVALATVSLWKLGRECQTSGAKTVRVINACVVVLGLLFIFLTFRTGQNTNYIMPVMAGVLDWKDLLPYLSLNLFFQAPFLGAWLFAYAMTYYLLARKGRESGMLCVTAVYAGLYAALNLRQLAAFTNELLVADCLGVAGLVAVWNRQNSKSKFQTPKLKWVIVLPFAWCGLFGWKFFSLTPAELGLSYVYFKLLLLGTVFLFGAAFVLAWRRGVRAAWVGVGLFLLGGFLLLADSYHGLAPNFNRLICLGFEFPHYLLGELLITAFVAGLAFVYCRWRPAGAMWWMDGLALLLIGLALVDFRLQQVIGTRLEWHVLAMGNSPKMMWRMAKSYLPGLCAGLTVLGLTYALLWRGLRRWLWPAASPTSGESSVGYSPAVAYAFASFLLLSLLGFCVTDPDKAEGQTVLQLARTSPIWKRMANRTLSREEFLRSAQALQLGNFVSNPPQSASSPPADLNVVLVFMESTYNQHLSLFGGTEDTQPLLSKYKDRMELFPNFFSTFASSIHARFASFTGLYPVRDYNAFTLERVPVESIFEVMHNHGYVCSMFYSSFLDFTGFRNFLEHRGIEELYDADTMPGERKTEPVSWGLREEETLEAMRAQIRKYGENGKRFFMTYVPAAPHYPFEKVPERFHKYKPAEMGDYTPMYLNELLYMDWVLASLVEQLKESGLLDKTLVVITDDHGEWLGANGTPIGHGWWLTPELVNAPLIVMDPRKPGYRLNKTIGSQIDLLPTMLDLLSIQAPQGQLYQGQSLYAGDREPGRRAYLNSMQQCGVLEGNHLLIGDRDLKQSTVNAWTVSNEGAKTVFTVAEPGAPIQIGKFDDFQANLLKNYAYYCEMLSGQRVPMVTKAP
jgi:arylsulfatase A-like enzyme